MEDQPGLRIKLRSELEAPPALRRFGSGWINGVLGVVLGLAGLCLVLCLRLPGALSMPELREHLNGSTCRFGLHVLLLLAFAFSVLSTVLRSSRILDGTGLVIVLLASLLGGSWGEGVAGDPTPLFLGLDFFGLNLLFTGFLFIPLERLFAKHRDQSIFRDQWREDLFLYPFMPSRMKNPAENHGE